MTFSPGRTMAGHIVGDRYMLLSLIAKGGMGEVWKARDQRTGKIVAAKVLRPELSGESLPLNRLRLEAQNTLLIEHPNIAAVYDSGEDQGRGWLVMELIDGRPLTDYLRQGNRIAPAELIPLLVQMGMALSAAADAGVVHRDIKPANILIRPNGVVKITDFGISRTKNQVDLTAAGMVMGTAQYLPPEQALGEQATSVGDLYSVGVIAYEASAGKRPFTGKSQVDIAFSHVHDPLPPLPADVPEPLANVIYHLLEKEPKDRIQTGRELVRELITAARTLGVGISAIPVTLPRGTETPPHPTQAQPVVPPVQHTRVRTLPEEMLQRPDLENTTLDNLVPPRPVTVPPRRSLSVRMDPAPQTPAPRRPTAGAAQARTHTHTPTVGAVQRAFPSTHRAVSAQAPAASSSLWKPIAFSSASEARLPRRPQIPSAYSRRRVAPEASSHRRKVGWLWAGITLLFLVILAFAAAYFLRLYNVPLPFFGGDTTVEYTPSSTTAPFIAHQEAHHV